jgi:hypothetical protein
MALNTKSREELVIRTLLYKGNTSDMPADLRMSCATYLINKLRGNACKATIGDPTEHGIAMELARRIVDGKEDNMTSYSSLEMSGVPFFEGATIPDFTNFVTTKMPKCPPFSNTATFEATVDALVERSMGSSVIDVVQDALTKFNKDSKLAPFLNSISEATAAAGASDSRRVIGLPEGTKFAIDFWKSFVDETKTLKGYIGPFKHTGLGRPGDLVMVGGFTATFKTQLCTFLTAKTILDGKNVIYLSTEVSAPEMYARLALVVWNITYPSIQLPLMPQGASNIPAYTKAVELFEDRMKSGEIGRVTAINTASDDTIDALFGLASGISKKFQAETGRPASMLVIDYLGQILPPGTKSGNENEGMNKTIAKAKDLALQFNNSEGILVLTPWQVARYQYAEALKEAKGTPKAPGSGVPHYKDASVLSNAHEAERSADRVIGIFNQSDYDKSKATDKATELVLSDLKSRRSKRTHPVFVEVQHNYGIFTDLRDYTPNVPTNTDLLDKNPANVSFGEMQ